VTKPEDVSRNLPAPVVRKTIGQLIYRPRFDPSTLGTGDSGAAPSLLVAI